MSVWCRELVVGQEVRHRVRIVVDSEGRVESIEEQAAPGTGDELLGVAIPGIANAHSHAFHRALRGQTHNHGGDFWVWRQAMYAAAARLDPQRYYALAQAVFAEMVTTGYTAVGEFHYVHHRRDGSAYPHEMEMALAQAADDAGIRLTLLDTAYLAGGVGAPLSPEQTRFVDGSAEQYLQRWYELRELIPSLGAAIHSVRAVPPADIKAIVAGLPADVPLHIHLSEQPQENIDSLGAWGVTPTQLLEDLGALSPRMSAVHATHLTDHDITLLGSRGTTVVMCPTTEADLGDGIGPARELQDAGASIALGSDQNALIDPFAEIRSLEMHDRLRSRRRGRFSLDELAGAAGSSGYRSLGHDGVLTQGSFCDLVEIDASTVRTAGAALAQLHLVASASDVKKVIVGGSLVASDGRLASGRRPAELMLEALRRLRQ